MRRDFLVGIGLLASVAAGGGSAVAADIPVRPVPPAAAPATCCAVPDWVGFYVGIHGGGGGGRTFTEQQTFFPSNFLPSNFFTAPATQPRGDGFAFSVGPNMPWWSVMSA